MKVALVDLKKYLPNLNLPAGQLATKLSLVGHETEVVNDKTLEIKLTSNRKDCQDLKYLAFDIAALYPEFGDTKSILTVNPGQEIPVTLDRVNQILGSNINSEQYNRLECLGFKVSNQSVTVPDFRTDITEAADIAEEVFRIIGAEAINIEMLDHQPVKASATFEFLNNIRFALSASGASEIRTISFSNRGVVELKNPFSSNQPFLQADLTDGLLETLAKNPFSRRNIFFEIADVFLPEEETHLGIVISGYKKPDEVINKLSNALGRKIHFQLVEQKLLDGFSVKQPNVYLSEVDVSAVRVPETPASENDLPMFKKISQYPPMVRDVTITEKIDSTKLHQEFPELHLVELIDSYTDSQTGRISDTYRLIFQQHEDSFTAEQIANIDERLDKRFFGKS